MAYHYSQEGSYADHSQFADGQVYIDNHGNAVYRLHPDGSPQLIPAGQQSPYQGAQSPGDYSPGFDLGKLEDFGPLALNSIPEHDLADMDRLDALMKETEAEEMEDTIPYFRGSQIFSAHESMPMPTAQASSPIASLNGGKTLRQATPSANQACSPFSSLNSRRVVLNVDFRPVEVPVIDAQVDRRLSTHQAVPNPVIAPSRFGVENGMQRVASPGKKETGLPAPRSYRIKSVEQRAKEEKKRAANYLAVRKNRLTAAERQRAILQRLYFLEKVMEHYGINICPTVLGLPRGYGDLKFVPTTCEEKKLNLPSSTS